MTKGGWVWGEVVSAAPGALPPAAVFPLQNQGGKKVDFLAEKYTGVF